MYGGYVNKILRVNLNNLTTEIQQLDEAIIKKYIGGSGIGAKFLHEETTKLIDPLSSESPIIFMTGPLTGSGVPIR